MSPKTTSTSSILHAIANEKLGFKFGPPDRPNEAALACLLPILRQTSHKRQYLTYAETEQLHVSDSGSIQRLNVKNTSKDNVFLRSGTIFAGKETQSRALTRSAVIFPGQQVSLDVRCVHASHGIRTGAGFEYGGVTPLSMDSAFYKSGYTPSDQQTMWHNVSTLTAAMSARRSVTTTTTATARRPRRVDELLRHTGPNKTLGASGRRRSVAPDFAGDDFPAMGIAGGGDIGAIVGAFIVGSGDDLRTEFNAFAKDFDGILSRARLHDDQVGVALVTDTGCKTIELFDVPMSWEALHKDAVKRMGTELLRGPDEASVFEYKPERAAAAARKVLSLEYARNLIFEHKPSNGEPHVAIYGLTAKQYVGEAVELGGSLIHLVILESGSAK